MARYAKEEGTFINIDVGLKIVRLCDRAYKNGIENIFSDFCRHQDLVSANGLYSTMWQQQLENDKGNAAEHSSTSEE